MEEKGTMTLDEAIAHAREVAEEQGCTECGENHAQLAKWLEELRAWRKTGPSQPAVRGKWISAPHKLARFCDCCGYNEPYKFADKDSAVYTFCPNCGAKMGS